MRKKFNYSNENLKKFINDNSKRSICGYMYLMITHSYTLSSLTNTYTFRISDATRCTVWIST